MLEQVIVKRSGDTVLNCVTVLMSRSNSLWHDLMHGIHNNVKDQKLLDVIESSNEIIKDIDLAKERNAKVRALRRIASFFVLLADTFEAIEKSIDIRDGDCSTCSGSRRAACKFSGCPKEGIDV
jgi:hypothetical protein